MSQPVLDALFQKGVVVCEGDPDRAIYQAAADRHCRAAGGDETAFVHSNGKDAAKTPIRLFRETGTPVAAIVDIDVLNSEQVLAPIYEALTAQQFPPRLERIRKEAATYIESASEKELLARLKADIATWSVTQVTDIRTAKKSLVSILKSTRNWERAKRMGVAVFSQNPVLHQQVVELIDELAQIGLFIVPVGELECWLKNAGVKGHAWNRRMLETIAKGACPTQMISFIEKTIGYIAR